MASRAIPIPQPPRQIGGRAARHVKPLEPHGSSAGSEPPLAPLIGSLPAPRGVDAALPDLNLPESTPEAFSLAEAASVEYANRLIGVSSAPARTFMEQAARRGGQPASFAELGTSPSVLSVLQQQRGVAPQPVDGVSGGLSALSLAGPGAFAKEQPGAGGLGLGSHAGEGGLSAMLRSGGNPGSAGSSAALGPGGVGAGLAGLAGLDNVPSGLAPIVGSYGARVGGRAVTLATSFRDASAMPMMQGGANGTIREEGEGAGSDEEGEAGGLEDNSDGEWERRKQRGIGVRAVGVRGAMGDGDDSSDDEAPLGAGAAQPQPHGDVVVDDEEGGLGLGMGSGLGVGVADDTGVFGADF